MLNIKVKVRHRGIQKSIFNKITFSTWTLIWKRLKERDTDFIIEPYIRFKGEVGEQATMFLLDPCGNALEFKAFQDKSQIFAK